MPQKNTDELTEILGKTHHSDFERYYRENKESMISEPTAFTAYIRELLTKKGLTQQKVFLRADIPERYGYKLLSGEKHTKQRDVILRICYAAELTVEETQRVLRQYEMPELYAKLPRDALLIILFSERPGSILDINSVLKRNGFEPLRTSGVQE